MAVTEAARCTCRDHGVGVREIRFKAYVNNNRQKDKSAIVTYTNGLGFSMSLLWISQTGAGSRNGGFGTGGTVLVAGTMGPSLVFQWTRIPCDRETKEIRTR